MCSHAPMSLRQSTEVCPSFHPLHFFFTSLLSMPCRLLSLGSFLLRQGTQHGHELTL